MKNQKNAPQRTYKKYLNLVNPPRSASSSAWNVFKTVQSTKFWGHSILAGQTRIFLNRPANPNPVNCVPNTMSKLNKNPNSSSPYLVWATLIANNP